jgi:hypothetical protein
VSSPRGSASSAPSAGHEPPSVRGLSFEPRRRSRGQYQSLEHYGQVVGDDSAAELSKGRPSLESGPACFLRLRRARSILVARMVLRRWSACHLERLRVRLHEGFPPLSRWHLLADLGELAGRRGLEGRGRGFDPGGHVLVALGLILAGLNQTFQLVGILGQTGLWALTGFVLLNESADGLTGCCGETGHLVGRHLRIRGGHHVGLANGGYVPDGCWLEVSWLVPSNLCEPTGKLPDPVGMPFASPARHRPGGWCTINRAGPASRGPVPPGGSAAHLDGATPWRWSAAGVGGDELGDRDGGRGDPPAGHIGEHPPAVQTIELVGEHLQALVGGLGRLVHRPGLLD